MQLSLWIALLCRALVVLTIVFALVQIASSAAKADITAIVPSGSIVLGIDHPGYLLGSYFTPNFDLYVTALSYWDRNDDGFNSSHEVGIYDAAADRLLFSTTLSAGASAPLSNHYRYGGIPTQLLTAGTQYAIVGTAGNDDYLADLGVPTTNGITLTSGGQAGFGATLPPSNPIPTTYIYSVYGGPNFQFTTAAAPEPSTGGLLFAVGLGCFCRRFVRRRG